jgi:predicted dehydrogenase
MKLGILGVQHPHARAWAAAAQSLPYAGAAGVTPTVSAEALLEQVDAVIVAGKNAQLAQLAAIAVTAGRPALVEKPGALELADLETLRLHASQVDGLVRVAYFRRNSCAVQQVLRALREGVIGDPRLVRLTCAIPATVWATPAGDWFKNTADVPSAFVEAGCHMIDIGTLLLGPLRAQWAHAGPGIDGNHSEGSVTASLVDDKGAQAALAFDAHEHQGWDEGWSVEVSGTAGMVRAQLAPHHVISRASGSTGWHQLDTAACPNAADLDHDCANVPRPVWTRQTLEDFLTAVQGGPTGVGLDHAIHVLATCHDIVRLARR